ncbi:LCP family protein [Paenibacillus chartarius]|uniref:LCP family protein n=1 Tax=Paenibacillus chartarius TaxID=747481 RepID=A0ABV6DTQ1_9BACL
MRTFKWLMLTVGLLIVVVIGYYGYSFYSFASNISERSGERNSMLGQTLIKTQSGTKGVTTGQLAPPKWEGKERVNILLLGGDPRGATKNDLPRSDSMIVVSIDPVTKQGHLFSILRDTYVKIPGEGEDRINTAISYGGPNLAMKTVGDLLGIPIQYYVYTDFDGFIALVDSIGGIDLEVEKDMKYIDSYDDRKYDINLKKGFQHLDGKTALQYVRFRHDATSDFTRTERQRKFLQAVAVKLQSTSSLIKLPVILNSIDPYIETNLSIGDMVKLGGLGFELKANGVASKQLPPTELLQEKTVRGAEVITANKEKLQSYVKDVLAGKDPFAEPAAESKSTQPAAKSSVKTMKSTP